MVARVDASGHALPRYHEPYVGRHRNKVDFVSSLRAEAYRFYTLLREYLAHVPHATGPASDDGETVFREMVALYQARREQLGRFYNRTAHNVAAQRRPARWDAAGLFWPVENQSGTA